MLCRTSPLPIIIKIERNLGGTITPETKEFNCSVEKKLLPKSQLYFPLLMWMKQELFSRYCFLSSSLFIFSYHILCLHYTLFFRYGRSIFLFVPGQDNVDCVNHMLDHKIQNISENIVHTYQIGCSCRFLFGFRRSCRKLSCKGKFK